MANASLGIIINSQPVVQAVARLKQLTQGSTLAGRAVQSMSANAVIAMNQMNGAIQGSLKYTNSLTGAMRKLGSGVIQNVSWQIGDMATQFSAGTAAGVVFGQQIPQILSSFGTLGAAVGALAAIGIPIFAVALSRGGEEVLSLDDRMKTLNETLELSRAATESAQMGVQDLIAEYGRADEAVQRMIQGQKDLAFEAIADEMNRLRTMFSDFGSQELFKSPIMGTSGLSDEAEELAHRLSLSTEQFDALTVGAAKLYELLVQDSNMSEELKAALFGVSQEFNQAINDFRNADGIEGQIEAAIRLRDMFDELQLAGMKLPPEMMAFEKEIQAALSAAVALRGQADNLSGATAAAAAEAAALAANWESAAAGIRRFRQAEAAGMAEMRAREESQRQLGISRDIWGEGASAMSGGRSAPGSWAAPASSNPDDFQLWKPPALTADAFDLYGFRDPKPAKGAAGGRKKSGGGGGGKSDEIREMEREVEQRRRVIEGLEFEASQIGKSDTARRIANEARRAGVDLMSAEGQKIADLIYQIEAQNEAYERVIETQEYTADSAANLWNEMITGSGNAKDAIANLTAELSRMAAQQAFMNIVAGTGIGSGPFGEFLSSMFGIGAASPIGMRANGGPVRKGMPYIVGERRAELFVPNQNGTILPQVPANSGGPVRADLEVTVSVNDNGQLAGYVSKQVVGATAAAMAQQQEMNDLTFNDRALNAIRNPRKKYG